MVWTVIERRKKDRATILGLACLRKKEERQSNNVWFELPLKEGRKTESSNKILRGAHKDGD